MNDFELSLLYDRLDSLVESGEMTEEEARAEWRDIVAEQMERSSE
jgi:polyhydroxyalkanoate synthesis regulator phasin